MEMYLKCSTARENKRIKGNPMTTPEGVTEGGKLKRKNKKVQLNKQDSKTQRNKLKG